MGAYHSNWGTWVKKHGKQILGPPPKNFEHNIRKQKRKVQDLFYDSNNDEIVDIATGVILQEGAQILEDNPYPDQQWRRRYSKLGGKKMTRMDKSGYMAEKYNRMDKIWERSEYLVIPNLVRQEFLRLLQLAIKRYKRTYRTGMLALIYISWHAVAGMTWQQFEEATNTNLTTQTRIYVNWAKTIDSRYNAPYPTVSDKRSEYFRQYYAKPEVIARRREHHKRANAKRKAYFREYYRRPEVRKRYKEHRAKNAEKRKAYFKAYYSDPANKRRHKENCARWQRENRERKREYSRKWAMKNKEKYRKRALEWYYRNREKVNQKQRERYARRTAKNN